LEQEEIIQKTLGGIAVGAIDFRDKSKLKNRQKASKDKTTRLEFWQDFLDKVGVVHLIKLKSKKPDLSLHQAKFYWLKRCASKTLAILFYVLGKERFVSYLYRLIEHGESKFTQKDRKLIEYLQNHIEYLDLD
jgi:hypothetical protein